MATKDPGNIANLNQTNPNQIVEITSPEIGPDNFISKRTVVSSADSNIAEANALDNWSTMGVRNISTIVEVKSADASPIEVLNFSVDDFHHPATVTESGLKAGMPDSREPLKRKP